MSKMTTQQHERAELICVLKKEAQYASHPRPRDAMMKAAALLAADAQAGGEAVARVVRDGATVRLEWASADAAHNAKPGELFAHPQPQSVAQGFSARRRDDLMPGTMEIIGPDGHGLTVANSHGSPAYRLLHKLATAILSASQAAPAAAQVAQPLTEDAVFHDDLIMAANADAGLDMARIMQFVRATEAAHGIGKDQG